MSKPEVVLVSYDTSKDGDEYNILIVGKKRPNESIEIINAFQGQDANELYWKLIGAKTEPGCIERNIWGKIEHGKLLCKDCGHTYESKCPCNAVKKMEFLVEE